MSDNSRIPGGSFFPKPSLPPVKALNKASAYGLEVGSVKLKTHSGKTKRCTVHFSSSYGKELYTMADPEGNRVGFLQLEVFKRGKDNKLICPAYVTPMEDWVPQSQYGNGSERELNTPKVLITHLEILDAQTYASPEKELLKIAGQRSLGSGGEGRILAEPGGGVNPVMFKGFGFNTLTTGEMTEHEACNTDILLGLLAKKHADDSLVYKNPDCPKFDGNCSYMYLPYDKISSLTREVTASPVLSPQTLN